MSQATNRSELLRLEAVTKRYADHLAVNQVSLSIPSGIIYGLLGPNGAGKTSIIRMITSITAPDEGRIWFDGRPLTSEDVYRMGYMPEERGLYKKMTVWDQLLYLLQLKGLPLSEAKSQAQSWLKKFDLLPWKTHKTSDLSKGMQQKVQFIATVAHAPKLLILDEPFSGLDPVNTQVIESEIQRLKREGTTIIFSTHRMEQVEELCDYIALINKGKVMIEDSLEAVRQRFQRNVYNLSFQGNADWIRKAPQARVLSLSDTEAQIELSAGNSAREVLHYLIQGALDIQQFGLSVPKLNDIFIELVEDRRATPTS